MYAFMYVNKYSYILYIQYLAYLAPGGSQTQRQGTAALIISDIKYVLTKEYSTD